MDYITTVSLEYTKQGVRTEAAPGSMVSMKDNEETKRLVANGHLREPSEAEAALYAMQNPKPAAPAKVQTQPATPNGPGGASEVTEKENLDSTVATDADTVAAGTEADVHRDDDNADGEATASEGDASQAKPAKSKTGTSRAKRDADLA